MSQGDYIKLKKDTCLYTNDKNVALIKTSQGYTNCKGNQVAMNVYNTKPVLNNLSSEELSETTQDPTQFATNTIEILYHTVFDMEFAIKKMSWNCC